MAEKESKVSRWEPFGELDLLEDWHPFRELGRSPWRGLEELIGRRGRAGRLAPAMDVAEDDGQYTITVELPGAKRDDVVVELHDNVLTIRGEKKSEREEKKEQVRWVERTYGSFSRSFTLPPNADGTKVQAGFENGVLTLAIPKAEEAKPRQIHIKS